MAGFCVAAASRSHKTQWRDLLKGPTQSRWLAGNKLIEEELPFLAILHISELLAVSYFIDL